MDILKLPNNLSLSFCDGSEWKDWMKCYRFGALVFIPEDKVYEITASLRRQFDPSSAKHSIPHVTLTQPFSESPRTNDLSKIKDTINSFKCFKIQTGPVISSPNKKLMWVDINPKESFVNLRNELHKLGLFRTDLPFTRDFTPHMTISEFGEIENIDSEIKKINQSHNLASTKDLDVKWIVPDNEFVFKEVYSF